MRNEFDQGFEACENDYLVPLQSQLQEILCTHKIPDPVRTELLAILKASDFRNQWKVKNEELEIDKAIEADRIHQTYGI